MNNKRTLARYGEILPNFNVDPFTPTYISMIDNITR